MEFPKIEKKDRHNFLMKIMYEDWTCNFSCVINNLWRIEDEIEKLSDSPTKEELDIILSNIQTNINKSIWDGCPVGRKKKIHLHI